MMRKNQEIELTIHDLHSNGFGVGRSEIAIFVEGALPGDHVRVKILKVKKQYAYGKIMEIIKPSPNRLVKKDPRICPVAKRCGGCQFQHLEYPAQLAFKEKLVRDVLIRIGKCETPPVAPILGMEGAPYNYRNKAQLPVGSEDGKPLIGFYAPRSHRIVPIYDCNIQHPVCGEIIKAAERLYDEKIHKNLLRHIVIKTGFNTGEVMVVLVLNGSALPYAEAWIKELQAISPDFTLVINKNNANTNVIFGPEFTTLYGSGYIFEEVGGIRFRISPKAFFQINTVQMKVLYDVAAGHLTGNERVIDAFSGIGSIALYVAKKAQKVTGVEVVQEAKDDATYNAAHNGIKNVEFICGMAEDVVPDLLESNDVLILDPPRKGCDVRLLESVIKAGIAKVIYVSCDPATLARDVKILTDGGYMLKHVQPVDMFPMTGHVETVSLLTKI